MPISNELSAEELFSATTPLHLEKAARAVRTTRLSIIRNASAGKKGHSSFGAPGTITLFLTRKGSGVSDQIRAAIKDGGDDAPAKMAAKWKSQLDKRQSVSLQAATKQVLSQEVFASISYGGATVIDCLWVPRGLDCAMVVLPYNGGALAREGFVLIEYHKDNSTQELEAVVLQTAPPLTNAESAALKQVPASQAIANVGTALKCDTTWWGVVAVVVIVVLIVAALATAGCVAVADTHVSEEELKKLGPAASARRILALRRRILMKQAGLQTM